MGSFSFRKAHKRPKKKKKPYNSTHYLPTLVIPPPKSQSFLLLPTALQPRPKGETRGLDLLMNWKDLLLPIRKALSTPAVMLYQPLLWRVGREPHYLPLPTSLGED
jgi:hypothetical protein